MGSKNQILLDTNILLDVFMKREPFYENSSKVFAFCCKGQYTGSIAAHSFTNMFYLMRKNYSQEELRKILFSLTKLFKIVSLNKSKIIKALKRNDFQDFEDCLQDECAAEVKADYVITRNPKDFFNSLIPVLSPEEFLKRAEY